MNKNEYLLDIRVKNNNLAMLMKALGIKNAAELSRVSGVTHTNIGQILNLKISATTANGNIRTYVQALADFFNVLPENLFPEECFHDPLYTNRVEREVSFAQLCPPSDGIGQDGNEALLEVLNTLTARERDVIKRKFGLDGYEPATLEDIGKIHGVSHERVRQIQARAFRKLRDPSRSNQLKEIISQS